MSEKNGTGPRIQRREKWIDLPEEYEGFQIKVWLNHPYRLWQQFTSTTGGDERLDAAALIILEHNEWLDYEGEVYPPPQDPKFWQEIPTELASCIIRAVALEQQTLPNSLAPRKRR